MSLYDGVGIEDIEDKETHGGLSSSQISGWSSNLNFMKTQLQLKKASQSKGSSSSGGSSRKSLTSAGPGSLTLANLTGSIDNKSGIHDEYDPFRPNDYDILKEKLKAKEEEERREKREKERERERRERDRERDREKDRDRRRDRDDDDRSRRRDRDSERDRDRDRDRDKRRRRRDSDEENDKQRSAPRSGAAIAPPPSLIVEPTNEQDEFEKKMGAGTGGFSTGNLAANKIMAKYGWKEGQGLGKDEQGLSTCLQVEKTSKRGGKIINKDKLLPNQDSSQNEPPPAAEGSTPLLKNISKVVILKNMVGPGEVDDELQPEVEEECREKYGEVVKSIIFEIPGAVEEEAVRIFVEFSRNEAAVKAVIDLNGRFFGGRQVSAGFYNLDRFRRLDLGG